MTHVMQPHATRAPPPPRADHTWMKNHPLEGDDIVTGLYNVLAKRNPKTMKPCHDILVPDTVVFEHNFPRGWYTTDAKAREVMRKQGKELDASTIERGFVEGVPEACPIVATYLCTHEEDDDAGNGETHTRTLVEVFNKDTLAAFLARKTKREGILQRFLLPKGYYNSVIQAVWSPRVCLVQRRTNKHAIDDKKRAEADPFALTVTYEGPTFLSDEGTVSGNIALEVKRLCGCVVQHFYYTEHKFITRMVLYFKMDRRNRLWLLWCSSLRVSDRTASSEMPVNLITHFAEPRDGADGSTDGFDEDALLYDADAAFVRVTHDEMFYETYVKDARDCGGSSDGHNNTSGGRSRSGRRLRDGDHAHNNKNKNNSSGATATTRLSGRGIAYDESSSSRQQQHTHDGGDGGSRRACRHGDATTAAGDGRSSGNTDHNGSRRHRATHSLYDDDDDDDVCDNVVDDADMTLGVDWSRYTADERATHARLCEACDVVLAALDDAFYRVRSHVLSHAATPNVVVVPAYVVRALTPDGVAQLMRSLGLPRMTNDTHDDDNGGDDDEHASQRYVLAGEAARCPVTKLSDDARAWVRAYYRRHIQRLATRGDAAATSAHDATPAAAASDAMAWKEL